MNTKTIFNTLKDIINTAEENMNSLSLDFLSDFNYNDIKYLQDNFSEYADNRTSIYYSDQSKYYYDHAEECEAALMEYYSNEDLGDYIKNHGLDALICHAGAIGEYNALLQELNDDEEEIKKVLSCYEIMRRLQNKEMNEEDITDIEELIMDLMNELN